MKPIEPKKLLAVLLGEAQGELPFEAAALARARALAKDPAAASPQDVEALPGPLAEAVLEVAVRHRAAKLVESLAGSSHKAIAKAAKKAIYRLRSAGEAVQAPDPIAAAAAAAPAPASTEATEEFPALLSALTGMGERALIFTRAHRGGGLDLYQLVMQDEHGVTHLIKHQVPRAAFRAQLREVRAGRTPPTLEVGRERVVEELGVAVGHNLRSRTPFPAGLDELLGLLGVSPREEPAPLPAPEEGDDALAMEAHTLHEEPELRAWLPPEKELRALSQRLDQAMTSPLQLTEGQKGSQVFEAFHRAAAEFFTPELKRLYARRLWAMAELFEHTGRERSAKLARAEARRLFHDVPGYFSRFGEFLFEKVLHLSAAVQRGQKLPEPGTSPKAAEPANEKKTPGGIILP